MDLLRNGKAPLLAAHRGVSGGNIPCNCEAAFRAAIAQGADIVELDVSLSAKGTLFVFHPGMEHPHLGTRRFLRTRSDRSIRTLRFLNQDNTRTTETIMLLDDALELLKDRCIVNLDKFWSAPAAIADCVRRHGMEEQVLIKTGAGEGDLKKVEAYAPDLPFLAIIKDKDRIGEDLLRRKLRFCGVEALFKTDDAPDVSDEHIAFLHRNGLCVWGNAIVYDYRAVIAAQHTDDVAVTGDPDKGWGWFMDKGFDIVQTDWLLAAKTYFAGKET